MPEYTRPGHDLTNSPIKTAAFIRTTFRPSRLKIPNSILVYHNFHSKNKSAVARAAILHLAQAPNRSHQNSNLAKGIPQELPEFDACIMPTQNQTLGDITHSLAPRRQANGRRFRVPPKFLTFYILFQRTKREYMQYAWFDLDRILCELFADWTDDDQSEKSWFRRYTRPEHIFSAQARQDHRDYPNAGNELIAYVLDLNEYCEELRLQEVRRARVLGEIQRIRLEEDGSNAGP